jgi:pimeloyl-ACP methyl ester carboxylesterase
VPAGVERRFVELRHGTVHCAIAGSGPPVLLLHQTPRSWDEYRDVLPLLSKRRQTIAMDTVGFGDSTPLPAGEDSIARWAEVAAELLDVLGLERAAVVGHHTGAYIAVELAASRPERVEAAVLSSLTLWTREERVQHTTGRAVVDDVDRRGDGGHVLELWRGRAAFYPPSAELLERYLVDCLRAGERAAEGHRVVARYPVEERLPLVRCTTLLVAATGDPHSYPSVPALRAALPNAAVAEIEGGTVALPDGHPREFATAVESFLDGLGSS